MTPSRSHLFGAAVLALTLGACSPEAAAPDTASTTPPAKGVELQLPTPSSEAPALAPSRFVTAEEMTSWFPSMDFAPSETPADADGRPLAYTLIGANVPEFVAPLSSGGEISSNDLAGQWTVLDFWGLWCSDCLADAPYVSALRTALQQDPSVDFLSIHTPPNADRIDESFGKWGSLEAWFADKGGEPYPVAIDTDASIRTAFDIYWTPTYLLIAPDLTIHGFRTDLSVDDHDGIKPVVMQIAQLRAAWNAAQSGTPTDTLEGAAHNSPRPKPSAPPSVISAAGLAGLSGQTAFESWTLKKAFDEYDVTPGEIMSEGELLSVFEVRQNGNLIATIEADASEKWVRLVRSVSREFTGPLGERIGRSRLGDIPASELGTCLVGVEEYADKLLCAPDVNSSFRRVFGVNDAYAGPMDNLPDDVRRAAVLTELHYLPNYPGRP